jgi:uncharacterized protein YhhL (DUF1145 family)
MKRSSFDNIVSFLQGTFWALLILGVWIIFNLFYPFGLVLAVFFTFLYLFFMLLAIVILENARTNRLKADEVIKQTELLESIRRRLENS